MPLNLFKKIIDQIRDYAMTIKLSYLGEPLLNSNLFDMIAYAKENSNARVTLFTNGTLMTHQVSVDIVESGLDEIVFILKKLL